MSSRRRLAGPLHGTVHSGWQRRKGIARIKSGLAKNIFRQELTEIYRQQTQRRDELVQQSGEVMKELIRQMLSGTLENPRVEQLMGELAQRLKSTSGRKQYGYLKAPLKAVVDEIVDELAKDSVSPPPMTCGTSCGKKC